MIDTGRKPAHQPKREVDHLAADAARYGARVMAEVMKPATQLMVEFTELIHSGASDREVIERAHEIERQLPSKFKSLRTEILERYLLGKTSIAYRKARATRRRAFQEETA